MPGAEIAAAVFVVVCLAGLVADHFARRFWGRR